MEETKVKDRLTAAEYWEWRATIELGNVSKEKLKNAELEFKLMLKESELLSIRSQNFLLTKVQACRDNVKEMKEEYERYKKVLEESLGQSLNGKMITETFEIVDLPKNN